MIYMTKSAAILSLLEFAPMLRAQHKIVQATRDGVHVGWTRVLA